MTPQPASTGWSPTALVAGVDTHTDTHTVAILTAQGQQVTTDTFPADQHGYDQLDATLHQAGNIAVVGVEGTNSYGAGLTRALTAQGFVVQEVLRPTSQVRRMHGKSDPIDAREAASSVLSGYGVSHAKDTTTPVEPLRFLLAARTQLIKSMTAIANALWSLLITAPESVRTKYLDLTTAALVQQLAASRPGDDITDVAIAAAQSMRQLARAHRQANIQADQLEDRCTTW